MLTPKFKLRDRVFLINDNKLRSGVVVGVRLSSNEIKEKGKKKKIKCFEYLLAKTFTDNYITGNSSIMSIWSQWSSWFNEKDLYTDKETLIESIS